MLILCHSSIFVTGNDRGMCPPSGGSGPFWISQWRIISGRLTPLTVMMLTIKHLTSSWRGLPSYNLEFYFSSSLQRVRGSDWLLPLICIRWPGIDVWPGPGLGILFVCVFPRYSQHTGNEYRALETQTKHFCPHSHPLLSTSLQPCQMYIRYQLR